jgi:hypothetical protein
LGKKSKATLTRYVDGGKGKRSKGEQDSVIIIKKGSSSASDCYQPTVAAPNLSISPSSI